MNMTFLFLGSLFQCRNGRQGSRRLQKLSESTSSSRGKRKSSNRYGQQQTH